MNRRLWRMILAIVSALVLSGVSKDVHAQSGTNKPAAKTDQPAASAANPVAGGFAGGFVVKSCPLVASIWIGGVIQAGEVKSTSSSSKA